MTDHDAEHSAPSPLRPPVRDLIRVGSRRWFLQTGLAGLAGLTLPGLLCANPSRPRKSVILIWLSGGPSQLDTWDPKPDCAGRDPRAVPVHRHQGAGRPRQ